MVKLRKNRKIALLIGIGILFLLVLILAALYFMRESVPALPLPPGGG
jgi:uncharacterized protein YpmB